MFLIQLHFFDLKMFNLKTFKITNKMYMFSFQSSLFNSLIYKSRCISSNFRCILHRSQIKSTCSQRLPIHEKNIVVKVFQISYKNLTIKIPYFLKHNILFFSIPSLIATKAELLALDFHPCVINFVFFFAENGDFLNFVVSFE